MPLRIARSKQQHKHCKSEFLSSSGAKTPTQSWRVLPKLQPSVSLCCLHQRWERSSDPGMQHLMDQQPAPLGLCLMKDSRFYAKSRKEWQTLPTSDQGESFSRRLWLTAVLIQALGKQQLRESSVRAGTNSHFLAPYSAYLQHSKHQETNRKKVPALMSLKLFLGEFNTEEVSCCQKDHNPVLHTNRFGEESEFSPHYARFQSSRQSQVTSWLEKQRRIYEQKCDTCRTQTKLRISTHPRSCSISVLQAHPWGSGDLDSSPFGSASPWICPSPSAIPYASQQQTGGKGNKPFIQTIAMAMPTM